ncbi:MAG: NADH-quinone oxidoreductase subunit C, partial [Steroidobacteraceae bacterium]
MTGNVKELGDYIAGSLPGIVLKNEDLQGELTLTVDGAQVIRLMSFLRDDARCLFKLLMDVCGADYPDRVRRFDVVYHLLSVRHNQRVRVKVETDET